MSLTATHTYAELEVSPAAYDEIAGKLREADYGHAFMDDGTIDMHGIGLTKTTPTIASSYATERKCKCPYPPVVNENCWCHAKMGNDFWFLPADTCLYVKPSRWRDVWRKMWKAIGRLT